MGNESFSAQEWIDYFLDKLERGIGYTVDQVRDVVKMISVKDPVAAEDALTVFYSGEGSEFPLRLSETAGGEIRMIDRTEACKFLAHEDFEEILDRAIKYENPKLDIKSDEFKSIKERVLYPGSRGSVAEGTWEASDGFWSIVSRRFASETSGDAYALVSNALPDGAKICGLDAARGGGGGCFGGVMRFGVSARFVCTRLCRGEACLSVAVLSAAACIVNIVAGGAAVGGGKQGD